MAYTQNFKALDGTLYTVQIDGVTLQTTPPLAAQPFDTQEDSDTDVYIPVRTQSGSVRLQSTDLSTWRSLIPSGALAEPVTLSQGNTIMWQGYIQTGTFGMSYPAIYEVIELPVVCPLGVLECIQVEVSGPSEMVTVGQLLNYIFSKLTGHTFDIYFSVGPSTYTTVPTWLQYKLVWRNFINKGTPATGRFSCLGLLQELCKFFGWSCRTQGRGIYFTSATDSIQSDHFIKYSVAGLLTPASGYTTEQNLSISLTDAAFANTSQDEKFIPGFKKVTINSELNAYNALIKLPSDEILKKYQYETPTKGYRYQGNGIESWILIQQSIDYENEDVTITSNTMPDQALSPCYGKLCIYDPDMGENKPRFGWNVVFALLQSVTYNKTDNTPLFSIESKDAFYLGNGTLYVKGGADFVSNANDGLPTVVCVLRVGVSGNYRYWNGSSWRSNYSTFQFEYTRQGIPNTRSSISEPEYEGYGAPISSTVYGSIYFAVLEVHGPMFFFPNKYAPIMNLEIGFARVGEDDAINDKSYMANGGLFPDETTIDTIFTTDKTEVVSGGKTIHCELGYGMLFGDNGIVDTILFGDGTQKKPEQHYANVIASFMNTSRRVLTLSLKTSVIGNTVGPRHTVTHDGHTFIPIAVDHSWRDDITTLTLMQKS